MIGRNPADHFADFSRYFAVDMLSIISLSEKWTNTLSPPASFAMQTQWRVVGRTDDRFVSLFENSSQAWAPVRPCCSRFCCLIFAVFRYCSPYFAVTVNSSACRRRFSFSILFAECSSSIRSIWTNKGRWRQVTTNVYSMLEARHQLLRTESLFIVSTKTLPIKCVY